MGAAPIDAACPLDARKEALMPNETVDGRLDGLEARVTRAEAMTEVDRNPGPMCIAGASTLRWRSTWPSWRRRSRITACCWPGCSTTSSGPRGHPPPLGLRVGGRCRVRVTLSGLR